MDEREHRIRERAHRLWEEEGRPEGRAERHWLQAEEIVAIEERYDEGYTDDRQVVDAAAAPAVEPIGVPAHAGENNPASESHIPPTEQAPQVQRGRKRQRTTRSE
ncbi:DUF2934 domain-containing protein [Chelatococcus asaccharovorans]|uniref:DUF2934 domain-containing protein n=1 Tax=Chelatococcus asaccharovorans TaxID=28210 RepID=UPI002264CB9A|nr:DUF2934 domain-containing protein [Chelatococcus asaccharovorans]